MENQNPADTPVQPANEQPQAMPPEPAPVSASSQPPASAEQPQPQPQVLPPQPGAQPQVAVPQQPVPTMVSTPAVPPPTGSIYPQASMGIGGPGAHMSKEDFEQLKPKSRKLMVIIIIAIPVVLIIALGAAMALNANIRDLVLMKSYRSYSYSNQGQNYTLNYYKGSTFEKDPFNSTANDTVIVSPTLADGALPIAVAIDTTTTSTNIEPSVLNCTLQGLSKAFSVHVPAANGTVNFCSIAVGNIPDLAYLGSFAKGDTHYAITIGQLYNKTEATTNKTYARQVLGKLGLKPYDAQIKQYVSTIKLDV